MSTVRIGRYGAVDLPWTVPPVSYTHLALDDDIWLYTGLTSVTSDKSNIGFILTNLRTKETRNYQINGAEENSAMDSAEGKVQEKKYQATFPILINVADQPTYFVSLKDDAGLVKQFAFVSVENYPVSYTHLDDLGFDGLYLRHLYPHD